MGKYVNNISSLTGTRTRVQDACESGLCPICTADCPTFCETSKAAVRGREALYPSREFFGKSTAGSPKDYGLTFADFQIQFVQFGDQLHHFRICKHIFHRDLLLGFSTYFHQNNLPHVHDKGVLLAIPSNI